MSSSLKQLEQFSPDFTWDLLSKGHSQFVQMIRAIEQDGHQAHIW